MTYIGIDGGGTTTRIAVQRDGGTPEYFERPVSLKVRDGDFAASAIKIRDIVAQTLVRGHSTSQTEVCDAIAIGLSGMSHEKDQESLKAALHALPEFASEHDRSSVKIHIESDATMTLKAVLPEGEEGILLIAGTGSVVFYQPSGGPARRIGGWGPLLSDEGSGYRIGLRALRYYLNMLDGIYPHDALCEAVGARIDANVPLTAFGEITLMHQRLTKRAENDPAFVASFAQDAFEAAANDPYHQSRKHVQDLINEELIDLTTMVFPLTIKGVMSGNMPYNLFLAGGIARQPMTIRLMEQAYEDYADDYFTLHLVDDRAPVFKALEIARMLSE